MDYNQIGLKVGIEIHQQLDTHKLFCKCPSVLLEKDPDNIVKRKLRAVASELGQFDPAALHEFKLNKMYHYQLFNNNTCLVELDEEPPHAPNPDAMEISIKISQMLNAKIVDEIQFMRKTVIDGSNTSGFQRTALVGVDGYLEVEGKKISIPTISVEEDAARKVSEEKNINVYRLDRLGIPLIEIGTGPDIHSPKEAELVAKKLGLLLRITGNVMRGLGTIRQDLNISIAEGARIELKGAQDLSMVSDYINFEIERQKKLISIKKELEQKGLTANHLDNTVYDISDLFIGSNSKIIASALKKGGVIMCIKAPGFSGLVGKEVQPGRRFGTEMSDYAKKAGVKGIFHSDELPNYGITDSDVENIRVRIESQKEDAFILVAGKEKIAKKALGYVYDRLVLAFEGVPGETRKAKEDGTSAYMRPLPGSARMYPETDAPPYVVTAEILEKIKENLPPSPEEKLRQYTEKGLSDELANAILVSPRMVLFDKIMASSSLSATLVASTLESTFISLRREGVNVESISDKHIIEMFEKVEDKSVSKEAIPQILTQCTKTPEKSMDKIIEASGLSGFDTESLDVIVKNIVEEKKDFIKEKGAFALGPIMGLVMKKVRGKVDGKLVSASVKKHIDALLN